MLQLELFDVSRNLLARSKRPALFPYSSVFVRHVRKFCTVVPLVLGALPEARTVVIHGIDQYVESESRPLRYARITLLLPPSHDATKQVQVLQAELIIGKELNALQSYMQDWFYTCMIFGIALLLTVQAAFIVIFKLFYGHANNRSLSDQEQRRSYREHYEMDGDAFSLNTLDFDSESGDDVWEVEDDENNADADEFWESLSDTSNTQGKRTSSEVEDASLPGLEENKDRHPFREVSPSIQIEEHSKVKVAQSQTQTFADTPPSKGSDNNDKVVKSETVEPSQRSGKKRSQRRRKESTHSKKVPSQHKKIIREEDERVQRIMQGFVEPYEIFTGEIITSKCSNR